MGIYLVISTYTRGFQLHTSVLAASDKVTCQSSTRFCEVGLGHGINNCLVTDWETYGDRALVTS